MKTVCKLEKRIEKTVLEVISDMGLKRLLGPPLLPTAMELEWSAADKPARMRRRLMADRGVYSPGFP